MLTRRVALALVVTLTGTVTIGLIVAAGGDTPDVDDDTATPAAVAAPDTSAAGEAMRPHPSVTGQFYAGDIAGRQDPPGGDVPDSHPEPPAEVVVGAPADTDLEQLAVDRLLADATGIGRQLWSDLDGQPCCIDATVSIDGVATLPDGPASTVVIVWTADGTTRTTSSTWTQTPTGWETTP